MSRRQKPGPGKVSVPAADDMLAQPFRLHCQKRHPYLGFYTRGEHDADHRLHDSAMNHTHKDKTGEEVEEYIEPGESDQSPDIR